MNDVFTPTRNLLLLKTVSSLIFLKTDMYSIFAQKDSVGAELGKEDIMLMLQ
jgi:hypothetical protein